MEKLSTNKMGTMATGTMAMMVASILTAGMGSMVLISTYDTTSTQASDVVNDTLANLCNGLDVVDATGHYVNDSLTSVRYIMRLSPGSQPINIENITVLVSNETGQSIYSLNDTERFSIYIFNGNGDMVLNKGELLGVTLPMDNEAVGEELMVKLIVENGQIMIMSFTVPDSLGNQFVQF
ncbi:MAG: hypothetical protein SA339_11095 [Methanomassiliicoccus sp.]|nr:hypothetical protein [Methanomassiliicoccus sp.]